MTWYETAQGVIAAATLPVTLTFLALFCRPSERWWSTWFGRSLFLLALGVLAYSGATVLYRLLGDYPGRPVLLIASTTLVFVAMVIRTIVLWRSQRSGERRFATLADAVAVVELVAQLEAMVDRVHDLDPCPNPDCMTERANLVAMVRALPHHSH